MTPGTKDNSWLYFLVAMVTDLCRHLIYDSRGAWHTLYDVLCMPCFSRIISEMLPEIHTVKQCDFLESINQSQIIQFSDNTVIAL